jgi:hypothetical protein
MTYDYKFLYRNKFSVLCYSIWLWYCGS